ESSGWCEEQASPSDEVGRLRDSFLIPRSTHAAGEAARGSGPTLAAAVVREPRVVAAASTFGCGSSVPLFGLISRERGHGHTIGQYRAPSSSDPHD
ncbi:unnamed protein product, partial [Urochloa humidicola]